MYMESHSSQTREVVVVVEHVVDLQCNYCVMVWKHSCHNEENDS